MTGATAVALEGASVGGAVLTPEAAALLNAYTLRARPQCVATQAQALGLPDVRAPLCGALAQDPNLVQTWHPDSLVLRNRVLRARRLELFQSDELEQHTIQGISETRLRRLFNSMRPAERGRVLDEIRQELRAVPTRLRGATTSSSPHSIAPCRPASWRALCRPAFRQSVRRFPLLR